MAEKFDDKKTGYSSNQPKKGDRSSEVKPDSTRNRPDMPSRQSQDDKDIDTDEDLGR